MKVCSLLRLEERCERKFVPNLLTDIRTIDLLNVDTFGTTKIALIREVSLFHV